MLQKVLDSDYCAYFETLVEVISSDDWLRRLGSFIEIPEVETKNEVLLETMLLQPYEFLPEIDTNFCSTAQAERYKRAYECLMTYEPEYICELSTPLEQHTDGIDVFHANGYYDDWNRALRNSTTAEERRRAVECLCAVYEYCAHEVYNPDIILEHVREAAAEIKLEDDELRAFEEILFSWLQRVL